MYNGAEQLPELIFAVSFSSLMIEIAAISEIMSLEKEIWSRCVSVNQQLHLEREREIRQKQANITSAFAVSIMNIMGYKNLIEWK